MKTLSTLVALALFVSPIAAQQRPLQLGDMSSMQAVGDPQLSPDGATVAYVRSQSNYETDAQLSEVVLVATSSGAVKATFAGSSPRWSPDGTVIAFMGRRESRSGLFIHNVASGAERFLVDPPQTDHWLGRPHPVLR